MIFIDIDEWSKKQQQQNAAHSINLVSFSAYDCHLHNEMCLVPLLLRPHLYLVHALKSWKNMFVCLSRLSLFCFSSKISRKRYLRFPLSGTSIKGIFVLETIMSEHFVVNLVV